MRIANLALGALALSGIIPSFIATAKRRNSR
jgi:hypothetical protein